MTGKWRRERRGGKVGDERGQAEERAIRNIELEARETAQKEGERNNLEKETAKMYRLLHFLKRGWSQLGR